MALIINETGTGTNIQHSLTKAATLTSSVTVLNVNTATPSQVSVNYGPVFAINGSTGGEMPGEHNHPEYVRKDAVTINGQALEGDIVIEGLPGSVDVIGTPQPGLFLRVNDDLEIEYMDADLSVPEGVYALIEHDHDDLYQPIGDYVLTDDPRLEGGATPNPWPDDTTARIITHFIGKDWSDWSNRSQFTPVWEVHPHPGVTNMPVLALFKDGLTIRGTIRGTSLSLTSGLYANDHSTLNGAVIEGTTPLAGIPGTWTAAVKGNAVVHGDLQVQGDFRAEGLVRTVNGVAPDADGDVTVEGGEPLGHRHDYSEIDNAPAIPASPDDIGAQPAGNYILSVNGFEADPDGDVVIDTPIPLDGMSGVVVVRSGDMQVPASTPPGTLVVQIPGGTEFIRMARLYVHSGDDPVPENLPIGTVVVRTN